MQVTSLQEETGFVTCDPTLIDMLHNVVHKIAPSSLPVVVRGESGTGKEIVAQAIHRFSPRSGRPLVDLNCACVPQGLLDSLLFGHTKGAFTGACQSSPGKLAEADGGTLFLDELGDMSIEMQVRLLRFLETGIVEPLGGSLEHRRKVDIRLVAATSRDLETLLNLEEFRSELYHRIKGITIWLPPLRDRLDDIPILCSHFLNAAYGKDAPGVSPEALTLLKTHPWPGNVRELKSCLEAAAVMTNAGEITADDIRRQLSPGGGPYSGGNGDDRCSGPDYHHSNPVFGTQPDCRERSLRVLRSMSENEHHESQRRLAYSLREEKRLALLRRHCFNTRTCGSLSEYDGRGAAASHHLRVFFCRALVVAQGDVEMASRLLAGDSGTRLERVARTKLNVFLRGLEGRILTTPGDRLASAIRRQYRSDFETVQAVVAWLQERATNTSTEPYRQCG